MKEFYIHIGHPKTGSSAIQAFLALNNELLVKQNAYYPNKQEFSQPFQTSSGNAETLMSIGDIKEIQKRLDQFVLEAPGSCTKIILSSENLFGSLKYTMDKFFNVFKKYDFKLICYVRRQDVLVESAINQQIKNHDFYLLKEYESQVLSLDYSKTILNSLKYIKAKDFIIRPYEKQQFHNQNIFSDFIDCIGLKWDNNFILPESHVNPSLGFTALKFRIFLNEIGFDKGKIRRKHVWNNILQHFTIEESLGKPFQKHSLLMHFERKKILERYSDENAQLAKIFMGRKNGKLFKDPIQKDELLTEELYFLRKIEIQKILSFAFNNNPESIKNLFSYLVFRKYSTDYFSRYELMCYQLIQEILSTKEIEGIEQEVTSKIQINLTLNYANFNRLAFNINNQISSSINIEKGLVDLKSNGNDPYFSFKIGDDFRIPKIIFKIILESDVQTIMQFFYSVTGKDVFNEKESIRISIKKGVNIINKEIQHNYMTGMFRLDPGNCPGNFTLHYLTVVVNPNDYSYIKAIS